MKSLDKQLQSSLQKIADDHTALVMSFVAPDTLVRKSPVDFDYTTIGVADLYEIESKLEDVVSKGELPKKLFIVIHTPGGSLYIATKIAKYLRSMFDTIEAYVPYEAASGGTIMCLGANEIILDKAANLTPIDPQVSYKDTRISCASYEQAIKDFSDKFGKLRPEEIPSPYQQMGNSFDPIIQSELDKLAWDTIILAWGLLKKSQNPKKEKDKDTELLRMAVGLVKSDRPHSHIIDLQEAIEIGLHVSQDADKMKLLKVFKKWVSENLNEEQSRHIVQTFCPKPAPAPTATPVATTATPEVVATGTPAPTATGGQE